jgi:hypothetical protein
VTTVPVVTGGTLTGAPQFTKHPYASSLFGSLLSCGMMTGDGDSNGCKVFTSALAITTQSGLRGVSRPRCSRRENRP